MTAGTRQKTHRIDSNSGCTEPLHVMAELLRAIARVEKKCALLTGAEAIASQRFTRRYGFEADWQEEFNLPFENRGYRQRFLSQEEIRCALSIPVRSYTSRVSDGPCSTQPGSWADLSIAVANNATLPRDQLTTSADLQIFHLPSTCL